MEFVSKDLLDKMKSDMNKITRNAEISIARMGVLIGVADIIEKEISHQERIAKGTQWTSMKEECGALDCIYVLKKILNEITENMYKYMENTQK